jgi:hypothetical protein
MTGPSDNERRCKVESTVNPTFPQKPRPHPASRPGGAFLLRLCFLSRASREEPSSFQGFSHAERPKDTAPLQSGSATYFPPKAVDAECRPPQTKWFWKRATKLRAISRAGSGRGPVRQHCRRGKLPPTRRTLLQIDVRGRRSILNARLLSCGFMPVSAREFADAALIFEAAFEQSARPPGGASFSRGLGLRRSHSVLHTTAHEESRSPPLFPTPAPCF